ncbi:hypothetical protein OG896_17500 [Streptomyces sp. NBC_00669]|uniref:hypothetical protein n=1 Tax=Streptomyces sp. NBC_00669 TaxID=2976011 RepID=UPI002E32FA8A|nr:hypothetical protein [Streptomyces sp. NBC_00669]
MVLVVVFGAAPLVAVPRSGVVPRPVRPASPHFPAGGALVGDGGLGRVRSPPGSPIVAATADLASFTALFTVPFTGGRHLSFRANPCPAAFESPGDAPGDEPGPPPTAPTQEAGHARS